VLRDVAGHRCSFRINRHFWYRAHFSGGLFLNRHRSVRRRRGRFDRLDETRRAEDRGDWLGRLGLLRNWPHSLAAHHRCFGEHVAAGQRSSPLSCQAFNELPPDDFFDGARRALELDAVIAFEQRHHFLAGRAQQLRNFVDPDSCH
jgi:hypothetical protein